MSLIYDELYGDSDKNEPITKEWLNQVCDELYGDKWWRSSYCGSISIRKVKDVFWLKINDSGETTLETRNQLYCLIIGLGGEI